MLKKTVASLGVAFLVSGALLLAGEHTALTAGVKAVKVAKVRSALEEREIGPFKTRNAAERERRRLVREGWKNCHVSRKKGYGDPPPVPPASAEPWFVYGTPPAGGFEDPPAWKGKKKK